MNSVGTRYKVHLFIPHQQFEGDPKFIYDIGLIRVKGSIEFNDRVQAIKYRKDVTINAGTTVEVTGWGQEQVS